MRYKIGFFLPKRGMCILECDPNGTPNRYHSGPFPTDRELNYQFKKLLGEFPEDNQEQTVEQLLNRKEAIEKLITVSVNKFIDDAEISVKSIELIHFESDRKKILQTKITLDL